MSSFRENVFGRRLGPTDMYEEGSTNDISQLWMKHPNESFVILSIIQGRRLMLYPTMHCDVT
jgi:hypothetical protein